MHGGNHDLFRPGTLAQGTYPDGRFFWLTRRSARELYPFAALVHGLRAELAISPEGLDSFLTQALTEGMKSFSDARRLDLLEALGVDYLLLDRELAPEALGGVREIASDENFGQRVRLYELVDRAREVEFATRIVPAQQMNAALAAIFDPAFDPHRTAVVPGEGPVREPPPGVPVRAVLVTDSAEEVVVDSDAGAPGVLFLRRAYLALWRVSIDGREAPTVIAQAARLGGTGCGSGSTAGRSPPGSFWLSSASVCWRSSCAVRRAPTSSPPAPKGGPQRGAGGSIPQAADGA